MIVSRFWPWPTMTSVCACVYLCAFSNDFFLMSRFEIQISRFFQLIFWGLKLLGFQRLEGLVFANGWTGWSQPVNCINLEGHVALLSACTRCTVSYYLKLFLIALIILKCDPHNDPVERGGVNVTGFYAHVRL